MRRSHALGLAVLALPLIALARGSGGGPPLYDGLCTAPSYLALGGHPPPPSVSQTYSATDIAQTLELADSQTTPQAQIIIGAGSLAPAPGSSTVTLSITAVKPPPVAPASGRLDGNVYDFEARSGSTPVQLAAGHPATIVLGATSSGGPQITLEHFDGTRWVAAVKTFQSGCGSTYEAAQPTLGLFALVASGGTVATGPGSSGGGSPLLPIVVVVVVVVVLAAAVAVSRSGRRRPRQGRRR